jgi:hypothetical protein
MRIFPNVLLACAAIFCAALIVPTPAKANDVLVIPKHDGGSPDDVKAGCSGGDYFPPSSENGGVYGCVNQNGSGIVCGGPGKYADTCSVFLTPPKRLPKQSEVQAAAGSVKQIGK